MVSLVNKIRLVLMVVLLLLIYFLSPVARRGDCKLTVYSMAVEGYRPIDKYFIDGARQTAC